MDNMLSNAFEKLLAVTDRTARVLNIGGYDHIDERGSVKLFVPPTPKALTVNTLDGFIGLLELNFETYQADGTNALVRVVDPTTVELIPQSSDMFGARRRFVMAEAIKPERPFQFNQYLSQEAFIIGLRTAFDQTETVDKIVATIGNLSSESEVRQEDDGFTQTATVKAGVVLKREKTINPRVALAPFRTFLEVDQPTSDYIVRLKVSENGQPLIALFEADAGFWKLQAIDNLQKWLQQRIKTSEFEAMHSISVVA